jgi:competence protein ComEA
MHKLITLLIALLMVSLNAFAAVNVNTASEAELQTLAGIGPAKAKAIIDYRDKNGAFKSVDDLTKVPGIGAGVLSKIRNDVTLTGSTTPPAAAAAAPANKAAGSATPATKMAPPAAPAKPATPATPTAPAAPAAPAAAR